MSVCIAIARHMRMGGKIADRPKAENARGLSMMIGDVPSKVCYIGMRKSGVVVLVSALLRLSEMHGQRW